MSAADGWRSAGALTSYEDVAHACTTVAPAARRVKHGDAVSHPAAGPALSTHRRWMTPAVRHVGGLILIAGGRQPQTAPWAAEPTSLAYLPSTPVV